MPVLTKAAKPGQTRAAAALALRDVLASGRALDEALAQRLKVLDDSRDRGLAQEIAYGVLRRLPELQALADQLLQKPMKGKDADVECLLLAGLYQLMHLRVPSHAAVSETVAASRVLKKNWASKLLNGVLRNFQRRKDELLKELESDEQAQSCFPDWLLDELRRCWPDDWRHIVQQSNGRPPMTLRVNSAKTDRRAYVAMLIDAGIPARPLQHADSALLLDKPVDVERLPGFADGLVSVQDGAAQLAAALLLPQGGETLLDACAAPGGKTAHLLELAPDADVTAVDLSESRLTPLRANLQRLGLKARVLAADLSDPDGEWAGRQYQRILLDVPCSATGVIRRHPDIKWLRRMDDIESLTRTQSRILDAVWPTLVPGGMLVYATCSLLAQENHEQMQAFLKRTPDAREAVIDADWGRACAHGRQLLPGDHGMDGFYYACLTKAESAGVVA